MKGSSLEEVGGVHARQAQAALDSPYPLDHPPSPLFALPRPSQAPKGSSSLEEVGVVHARLAEGLHHRGQLVCAAGAGPGGGAGRGLRWEGGVEDWEGMAGWGVLRPGKW